MATRRLVEIVLQGKDQTKGAFDSLANSLGVTDARVLKFAASATAVATAVGVATTAVYKFTAAQAEAGDRAAKLSYRLGLTVEGLSELEFIAGRGGVAVNTMTMALQRMVRRVAEAAKGTGEAKDAIKELGINAAALARLSPDQQFYEIAKALQEVERQNQRVRLAFKLLDSEGVAVIQTLKDDIGQTREEFERFGGAMSSEFSGASESFKDAQSNLKNATDRLKEALAEPFLSPFTSAINRLAEAIADAKAIAGGETYDQATPEQQREAYVAARMRAQGAGLGGSLTGGAMTEEQLRRQAQLLFPDPGVYDWGAGMVRGSAANRAAEIPNPWSGSSRGVGGLPSDYWPFDNVPWEIQNALMTVPGQNDLMRGAPTSALGGLMLDDMDTDFMRGMDDLIGKTEKFGSVATQVAGTFQSAMASAFATAITDADNAAEAIANIFLSTFANLAGSWLSSALFGALGLPTFSPFGGGGDKTVSDAAKAMPGATVLDKSGAYIDMSSAAYGKAFI